MATRTIITSQPDVACDVCARRLLRGEQPDIFIAAGRRRIVCELCAPRAAHEGWLRESQASSLAMPPLRPRRGRSLIDRLRQVTRPAPGLADELDDLGAQPVPVGETADDALAPFDFIDGLQPSSAEQREELAGDPAPEAALAPRQAEPEPEFRFSDFDLQPTAGTSSSDLERAVEIFNGSEFPRRVAGVARSLGPPVVNVSPSEHADGAVNIVVAWELCWYRYEVGLDGGAEARVIAQGTELSELAAAEQLANADADEFGELGMLAA